MLFVPFSLFFGLFSLLKFRTLSQSVTELCQLCYAIPRVIALVLDGLALRAAGGGASETLAAGEEANAGEDHEEEEGEAEKEGEDVDSGHGCGVITMRMGVGEARGYRYQVRCCVSRAC